MCCPYDFSVVFWKSGGGGGVIRGTPILASTRGGLLSWSFAAFGVVDPSFIGAGFRV